MLRHHDDGAPWRDPAIPTSGERSVGVGVVFLSLDGMLARVASARACPGRRGVPFYLRVGDQFDDTRGLAPAFAALTPCCVVFRVRPSAVDLTAG